VSKTRGTMGGYRFPGHPVVSVLPPKASIPIRVEKTQGQ